MTDLFHFPLAPLLLLLLSRLNYGFILTIDQQLLTVATDDRDGLNLSGEAFSPVTFMLAWIMCNCATRAHRDARTIDTRASPENGEWREKKKTA